MSERPSILEDPDEPSHDEPPVSHSPRRRRARRGCLPVLAVTVVVLVLAALAVRWGIGKVNDVFGAAPDYAGPGSGQVVVKVAKGASSTQIGRELKSAGVVKSVDAFLDAARSDSRSRNIQVGYYQLKKKMKASSALSVLIDPKNMIQSLVVVPEGARVRDIVRTIAKKTDIPRKAVTRVLARPDALGLPAAANGNPEGYLFPATYTVVPGETAAQLLKQMVAKTVEVQQSLHVADGAKKVGLTPEQVLTVASILEYEASRDQDYPKVARAIYNRLKAGMPIQSDATVSYANGVSGQIWTSASQRDNDSAYNTYKHTGLPPGPIGSPGEKTISAALHPADGPWLYWVVVNLRTGETEFSTTLAEHNAAVAKFRKYCTTSDAC